MWTIKSLTQNPREQGGDTTWNIGRRLRYEGVCRIIFQGYMIQAALNIAIGPLMNRCQELYNINCDNLWWWSAYILQGVLGEREGESGHSWGGGCEAMSLWCKWAWGRPERAGEARAPDPPATQGQVSVNLCYLFVPLEGQGEKL